MSPGFTERLLKSKADSLGFHELVDATMLVDSKRLVFPGPKLYQLKATHGLPLEVAVDRIMNEKGMKVDWVGFIEEARKNDWWDFQTVEVIEQALQDSMIDPDLAKDILTRLKGYILNNPHPKMEKK